MKLVISDPETGKTYQTDVEKGREVALVGRKIGETVEGGQFGAAGYLFEITGGSDTSGFPMRKDITGSRKLYVLLTKGKGFRAKEKGERKKKMVRGNTVSDEIVQLNMKVVQKGPTSIEQIFQNKETKEGEKKVKKVV